MRFDRINKSVFIYILISASFSCLKKPQDPILLLQFHFQVFQCALCNKNHLKIIKDKDVNFINLVKLLFLKTLVWPNLLFSFSHFFESLC